MCTEEPTCSSQPPQGNSGSPPSTSSPLIDETYPRDNQLPAEVLHLGLDFAADVELVAVEGNALKIGQQVLLAG